MTIRHLKTFIKVVESGSVSKAADELCIAQPSVSQTIKELEKYYGTILFLRTNKKLKLTSDGQILLIKAKEVVNSFNEFENVAKKIEFSPKISIGATLTFGTAFLPNFISKLKEEIPNIDPYIYIDKTGGLEEKILKGEIDFALVEGVKHSKSIKSMIVASDNLICVASPDYNVEGRLSIVDLPKYDVLRREVGSASRMVLDDALHQNEVTITPRMESISNASLLAMVKAGHGLAIMPKELVKPYLENGTLREIELDVNLTRNISIITHKNKTFSKVGKKGYNLAVKILKEHLLRIEDRVDY